MPSRNSIKEFSEDSYYHIYNRGVEKRIIFLDDQDYTVFLGLLKKYILGVDDFKKNRHKFEKLEDKVDILAYCLMPNHFHLLVYQKDKDGITRLARKLMTSYAMYFNNRYNRVGGLFQGRYKASLINADSYLHHISRYIHMNPEDYMKWPYSSLPFYTDEKKSEWLKTGPILELFDNDKAKYLEFVKDYNESKQELSVLKWQLANE
jgi:putative transposase